MKNSKLLCSCALSLIIISCGKAPEGNSANPNPNAASLQGGDAEAGSSSTDGDSTNTDGNNADNSTTDNNTPPPTTPPPPATTTASPCATCPLAAGYSYEYTAHIIPTALGGSILGAECNAYQAANLSQNPNVNVACRSSGCDYWYEGPITDNTTTCTGAAAGASSTIIFALGKDVDGNITVYEQMNWDMIGTATPDSFGGYTLQLESSDFLAAKTETHRFVPVNFN